MRLLAFFVLITMVTVAGNSYSQQTKFKLKLSGVTVREVFREIEDNSEFILLYNEKQLDANRKVNVEANNDPVEAILNQVFNGTENSYKIYDRQIVILSVDTKDLPSNVRTEIEIQQRKGITGTVKDSKGIPLPGVSVVVKGTTTGAITDNNGTFSLNIPDDANTLVFSFIGMKTQEIIVGKKSIINISLEDETIGLDEVVAVGYGTQKKYSVIGAITTISPQNLKVGTTRSMSNNLAGQLAGVIAVQRSGEPGYDNSSFWIRGISTFGGNRNPLVLIDGIERSLDNIDPEEIASFSILKDASASAVYGVRGANGVILINTKRGEIGKPKITVRAEQGFTQPSQLPSFVGAADYLGIMNGIRKENGKEGLYSQEHIDNTRNKVDPDLYPDVNWLDMITKDQASNSRVNLSVSGGSEILRYSLVASYYSEDGIIERDNSQGWDSSLKLKRYNVRSNVDMNLTPTTLFRFNIGGFMQDRNAPAQSIDALFNEAFTIPPFVHPAIYSTGEIPRTPERTNPWAMATQTGYERSSASKIESLFSLEQDLKFVLPGLKAKGLFSFDRYSNNSVKRSKSPDYYNPATGRDADGNLNLVIASYGQAFLDYETGSEWGDKSTYLEGNLSYVQNFGNHYIDAMFLLNRRQYDNGDKLPFRYQGIAGRTSYSYARRYIAEFNFGYNGSENFAPGNRYGFFPSVAVGWLLSEEPFMESFKNTISKVKFRGSYGLVGNDNLDGRRFAYITTIGDTDGYRWGVNNDYHRAGRREGDQGNEDLTWETVTKANVGFELGLWNSIEFQADFFKEMRRDIFMQRKTIPGSSGFINAPWANFGKVDNKGIDLSLDMNKQVNKDFFVSVRGTFTYAVNTIIEQDEPLSLKGTNRQSTGKSIGQIFGLVADGLFTNEDFSDIEQGILVEDIPVQTFGPVRPGDIKYKDINGDSRIDDLDRCAIGGTFDPQMVYGFGANLKYKNFDLGFFFQGMGETYRIIGGANFIPGSANGSMGNILTNVVDRWTVENPRQDAFYPRLSDYQSANNNQSSTWWLRDMSLLRLKNIELGYNFPKNTLAKAYMNSARIFVRGSNILTFSDFKLWDPEIDTSNGLRYPVMKSLSVGLEVNF
ncbi:MAG: TonB-dependent receptor [Prolixibacteraceae bacterium]|nr:TonB-dependent receptor [Prolixibacteraceae bacterium]